jgi:hypothetical protein
MTGFNDSIFYPASTWLSIMYVSQKRQFPVIFVALASRDCLDESALDKLVRCSNGHPDKGVFCGS